MNPIEPHLDMISAPNVAPRARGDNPKLRRPWAGRASWPPRFHRNTAYRWPSPAQDAPVARTRGMRAMAGQISNDESAQFISEMLDSALRRSGRGQKLWSFANHGSTICIVVFSAAVAVLSQTTGKVWNYDPKSVATILSLCITVISTVQSKLG